MRDKTGIHGKTGTLSGETASYHGKSCHARILPDVMYREAGETENAAYLKPYGWS